MRTRWTMKQLKEMSDNQVIAGVLSERLSDLNPYTPLATRLKAVRERVGMPKVREVSLYDDGSDLVLLLDEGQDIDSLLRQWVALDDELCRTGNEPKGWMGFSAWMARHGVRVIEHEPESINNFRA